VVPQIHRGFRLERATCEPGDEGRFELQGLAPGVYLVLARQLGVQKESCDQVLVSSLATAVALLPSQDVRTVVRWKPH
jgi:hypothetical protein